MTRHTAVAGMFYERDKEVLFGTIEDCFLGSLGPGAIPMVSADRTGRLLGLICPHAGYIYSGSAAAHAYSALATDGIPHTVVLLGPNHYGMGASVAVSTESEWQTPIGAVQTNLEVAQDILRLCEYAQKDERAHSKEHSIEVQLPFLQFLAGGNVQIVPIAISHLDESDALALCSSLGSAIAEALQGKSAVIIASTDFSHYETQEVANSKDALAIERVLDLDPQGLIHTVYSKQITMCGVISTAVMLEAAKILGATSARQLIHYTSGDITGDFDQVVGYAAIEITK